MLGLDLGTTSCKASVDTPEGEENAHVQAPLGWWTLRSIGTPRFQLVWSLGMLLRLAILAVAGVILVPALGWRTGPALGTLVGAMVALLLVEAVSAMREHSWGKG